jgi:hypothetical protein
MQKLLSEPEGLAKGSLLEAEVCIKEDIVSCTWWYTPVIPELRRSVWAM